MRQCKECGARFYRGEELCPYCGTNLKTGAPPRPEPEEEPKAAPKAPWGVKGEADPEGDEFSFHNSESYYKSRKHVRWSAHREDRPKGPPPLDMFRSRSKEDLLQAFLALFLGAFGVQWFYRGKVGRGLLCLLFSWTGIPAVLGVVEGLRLLYHALDDRTYLP